MRIAAVILAFGLSANLFAQNSPEHRTWSTYMPEIAPKTVHFSALPESPEMKIYNAGNLASINQSDTGYFYTPAKNKATKLRSGVVSRGGAANPIIGFPKLIDNQNYNPVDNTIGISNTGHVLTANNMIISLYDSILVKQGGKTLEAFFGILPKQDTGQQVFDPQILYDPLRDRWVVSAAYVQFNKTNGSFNISSSKVLLAFSQTNDAAGLWNTYEIDGREVVDGTLWGTDYPTLAFTNKELFVLGNLSKLLGSISHQIVFEIDYKKGYSGTPLTIKKHILTDISSFVAGHNNFSNSNSRLYMIHTAHSPNSYYGTRNLDICYLESDISNANNKISQIYHLDLPEYYYKKISSPQKGSTIPLQMTGSVARSAFYDKGYLHSSFTTVKNEKTAIYYLRIKIDPNDVEFSETYSFVFEHPTYELGYSSIQYGGFRSADSVDGVLIAANYTSQNDYPGYGLFYISPNTDVSDFVVAKAGENSFQWPNIKDTMSRWGDYTCIAKQHNRPYRFVVTGQYGMVDKKVGSHFVMVSSATAGAEDVTKTVAPTKLYPNPTTNKATFEINVNSLTMCNVTVVNTQGAVVKSMNNCMLKPGLAVLEIELHGLAQGVYQVLVLDLMDNHLLLSKPLIKD
ncbi:MAG: hypothetical protein IT244_09270 [Bacteroidia bacterium]|nr:hypothetical protein [Bacteroidia bacterium]